MRLITQSILETVNKVNKPLTEAINTKGKNAYTVCYGRLDVFPNAKEALDFYKECAAWSEGSERERYMNIVLDLLDGQKVAYDGVDGDSIWSGEITFKNGDKNTKVTVEGRPTASELIKKIEAGEITPESANINKNLDESVKLLEEENYTAKQIKSVLSHSTDDYAIKIENRTTGKSTNWLNIDFAYLNDLYFDVTNANSTNIDMHLFINELEKCETVQEVRDKIANDYTGTNLDEILKTIDDYMENGEYTSNDVQTNTVEGLLNKIKDIYL